MYGISNVTLVDVRPADEFYEGHVPFAINISADVFKSNITNPAKLSEILGKSGVNISHEAVVISGKGITKDAAFAFLMLVKLGQNKISILHDSHEKWVELGFKLTKDTAIVSAQKIPNVLSILPTDYSGNFQKDIIIADPKDTQGLYPKVFIASGRAVPAKAQAGKIAHVPYTDLLNSDGTPKAAKDIWKILSAAGVPRYAELVCYSDDPGEAAVTYFILRLMGYPDIKVLIK
jgi:thiosulfate/3-mercaptopyruvate sulfurtransferase